MDEVKLETRTLTHQVPEAKHYCPGVPIVLAGLKTDLRHDKAILAKLDKVCTVKEQWVQHFTWNAKPPVLSEPGQAHSIYVHTLHGDETYAD